MTASRLTIDVGNESFSVLRVAGSDTADAGGAGDPLPDGVEDQFTGP
jgi:hypothetical protein